VDRWRDHDVAAVPLHVEPGTEDVCARRDVVAYGVREQDVKTAPARETHRGFGELAVAILQSVERVLAAVARVNVESVHA